MSQRIPPRLGLQGVATLLAAALCGCGETDEKKKASAEESPPGTSAAESVELLAAERARQHHRVGTVEIRPVLELPGLPG